MVRDMIKSAKYRYEDVEVVSIILRSMQAPIALFDQFLAECVPNLLKLRDLRETRFVCADFIVVALKPGYNADIDLQVIVEKVGYIEALLVPRAGFSLKVKFTKAYETSFNANRESQESQGATEFSHLPTVPKLRQIQVEGSQVCDELIRLIAACGENRTGFKDVLIFGFSAEKLVVSEDDFRGFEKMGKQFFSVELTSGDHMKLDPAKQAGYVSEDAELCRSLLGRQKTDGAQEYCFYKVRAALFSLLPLFSVFFHSFLS